MLVYLEELPTLTRFRQHRLDPAMAPLSLPPSNLIFDSRTQIIDNCEFVMSKDDIVQVITCRDPADKLFKAYAICCNEDTREVVLVSDPYETAQKAVESLHTKSSEAVYNYMATNGLSGPNDSKAVLLEPSVDDDVASIISGHSESSTAAFSEWGNSDDEAMMLQRAPDDIGSFKGGQHSTRRKNCCVAATDKPETSRSRLTLDDADRENSPPPRTRAVRPVGSRPPEFTYKQAQPPPPPGPPGWPPAPPPFMRGMPVLPHQPPLRPNLYPHQPHLNPSGVAVGPHPPRPQNGPSPPMPPPPPQPMMCFPGFPQNGPPFPMSQGRPRKISGSNTVDDSTHTGNSNKPPRPLSVASQPQAHPVRITVHWLRHGQHRIMVCCQASIQSLCSAALADVRANPGAFFSDGPRPVGPGTRNGSHTATASGAIGVGRGGGRSLRASVHQAIFGGEAYDMRTFRGDDLTRMFHAMALDDIPCFEVVVAEDPGDIDRRASRSTSPQDTPDLALASGKWD
ncbi:hypothetical protein F5Y19DRAFT_117955 [Xylariaceae sp. FL1651]|nr:hypothetical protein F5Y19DRAFT_117955 [Xylariaceae sp. FL1651]